MQEYPREKIHNGFMVGSLFLWLTVILRLTVVLYGLQYTRSRQCGAEHLLNTDEGQ